MDFLVFGPAHLRFFPNRRARARNIHALSRAHAGAWLGAHFTTFVTM